MHFTLEALAVIQLIVSVLLPIAVGFVTNRLTSSAAKAWLLAGLTLLSTILTGAASAISSNVAFDLGNALISSVPYFAISVATYYGLWKPTGVAGAAQDVEATTIVR